MIRLVPRRLTPVLLSCLAVLLAACGDDPSGPGALVATVVAPDGVDPGGVVVEVSGAGVEGFGGLASSQAFAGDVVGGGTSRRVVVVGDGPLSFQIDVLDVAAAMPTATVLTAVGRNNQPLSTAGFRIDVEVRR